MKEHTAIQTMNHDIAEQSRFIEENRQERNHRYRSCLSSYKEFLNKQIEQFESTQKQNEIEKQLVSEAFKNTFERIVNSSDVSLRKIKNTYFQKKQFWNTIIMNNATNENIQIKKQLYDAKRQMEQLYHEAIHQQKQKTKSYHNLINKQTKNNNLRNVQQTNKLFQERVVEGTNTLMQWQNLTQNLVPSNNVLKLTPQSISHVGMNAPHPSYTRNSNHILEVQDKSTSFLDNFQKKR